MQQTNTKKLVFVISFYLNPTVKITTELEEREEQLQKLKDYLNEFEGKNVEFIMAGDANQWLPVLRTCVEKKGFTISKFKETRRRIDGGPTGRETD
mmetsp:Transcript_13435/g.15597  ORF Transcript_13435/g.15597 Transcript_13435/m.15597 type:complete len:96 (+) Transcript_13435:1787-2074(+)